MFSVFKHSFDGHSALGMSGFVATITLQEINKGASILVALATVAYMVVRTLREWNKFRKERKDSSE